MNWRAKTTLSLLFFLTLGLVKVLFFQEETPSFATCGEFGHIHFHSQSSSDTQKSSSCAQGTELMAVLAQVRTLPQATPFLLTLEFKFNFNESLSFVSPSLDPLRRPPRALARLS
jgi:hypothetical protein